MHLLYVDESGSVGDVGQRHFVMAGVSVFETKTHWIEIFLNELAAEIDPALADDIEFHGSPMRSGKGIWRRYPAEMRLSYIKRALAGVMELTCSANFRIFACVVEKQSLSLVDPVLYSFTQLTSRFDMFLQRLYTKHQDKQRGLMSFDKSSTERRLQSLALLFKHQGHQFGRTRNYAEVPVFIDSRASRLIQLADLVSFGIFRHFEHGDGQYFDLFKDRFDAHNGVQYGLHLVSQVAAGWTLREAAAELPWELV